MHIKPDCCSYDAVYETVSVRLAVESNIFSSVTRALGIESTTLQHWVDLATESPEIPCPESEKSRDTELPKPIRENRGLREDDEIR